MRGESLLAKFMIDVLSEDILRGKLPDDSMDDQIDGILLRFEADCIIGRSEQAIYDAKPIGESLRRLFEAPGDEDDEDKDNEDKDDKNKDDENKTKEDKEDEKNKELEQKTGDQEDEIPDQPLDPMVPRIDLSKFTGKVARFAANHEALLDIPIVIVNRAKNYLEQNYSLEVAEEFVELLDKQYGFKLKHDSSSEPRQPPMAVGAAASGLGG